jgi:hypothetical protein
MVTYDSVAEAAKKWKEDPEDPFGAPQVLTLTKDEAEYADEYTAALLLECRKKITRDERMLRLKALQDKADATGVTRAQLKILAAIGAERGAEILDDAWAASLRTGGSVWQ